MRIDKHLRDGLLVLIVVVGVWGCRSIYDDLGTAINNTTDDQINSGSEIVAVVSDSSRNDKFREPFVMASGWLLAVMFNFVRNKIKPKDVS